jgi:hypothetical protein
LTQESYASDFDEIDDLEAQRHTRRKKLKKSKP